MSTPKAKTKSKKSTKSKKEDKKDDKPKPLAQVIDEAVKTGGLWDTILDKVNAHAEKHGFNTVTEGTIKAHINYRLERDPEYLGKRSIEEDGIK